MMAMNCWQFKQCGREPGGAKVFELGVCPAAADISVHGINRGKNGGRICWAVTGTLCGGEVQGTYAQKRASCITCSFLLKVQEEEGPGKFMLLKPGQRYSRQQGVAG